MKNQLSKKLAGYSGITALMLLSAQSAGAAELSAEIATPGIVRRSFKFF